MSSSSSRPYENFARKYADRKCVSVRFTTETKPKSQQDVILFYDVTHKIYKTPLPMYDDFQFVGSGTDIRFFFCSTAGADQFHRLLRGINWHKLGVVSTKWVDLEASRKRLDNMNVTVVTTQPSTQETTKADAVIKLNEGGLLQVKQPGRDYKSMLHAFEHPDPMKTPDNTAKTPVKPTSPFTAKRSLFGGSAGHAVTAEQITSALAASAAVLNSTAVLQSYAQSVTRADQESIGVVTTTTIPIAEVEESKDSGVDAEIRSENGLTSANSTSISERRDSVNESNKGMARVTSFEEANERLSTLRRSIAAAGAAKKKPADISHLKAEYTLLTNAIGIHEVMEASITFEEAIDMAKETIE